MIERRLGLIEHGDAQASTPTPVPCTACAAAIDVIAHDDRDGGQPTVR